MAITEEGYLFMWGNGPVQSYGFLPQRICSIPNKVTSIAIGDNQMSALDETGITWVWGLNKRGELGLGDCTLRSMPYPLISLKEKSLTHVRTGHNYSIAFCAKRYKDNRRTKSEIEDLLGTSSFHSQSRSRVQETSFKRSDSRHQTSADLLTQKSLPELPPQLPRVFANDSHVKEPLIKKVLTSSNEFLPFHRRERSQDTYVHSTDFGPSSSE